MRKSLNQSLHSNPSTFSIEHINNFLQIIISEFFCAKFKRLPRQFFINFMSEKIRSADGIEKGIDKHMVASLYRLGDDAISMSLVSKFLQLQGYNIFWLL